MTSGLNKAMLIGRIGRAPETRFTPSGVAVTTFAIGVPRDWRGPDGEHNHAVDWFNVVAWGELAEQCGRLLDENDSAFVEGRLQVRTWTDAEGHRHHQTEIVAAQVLPLGSGAESTEDDG
ncbi:MAG: single-stranded DNA-binding protein [Caldilineae bacterium]|nr:single-stranded DNA-binding protein [Caldilineae bacterium]